MTLTQAAERSVTDTGAAIERLLDELTSIGDARAVSIAEELLRELTALYGEGLRRILQVLDEASDDATRLVEALAADPAVAGLLSLHDLHPDDPRARIERALDGVRPYLGSHGGDVEVLGLANGTLHLRLAGTCDGCPSSAATLESVVRGAIFEAAPEVAEIEVESSQARDPAIIPLEAIGSGAPSPASKWVPLTVPDDLLEGQLTTMETAGGRIMLARAGGRLYASAPACPSCSRSIDAGTVAGSVVTCAGCGHEYDLGRAGRCADDPALQLAPIPLLSDNAGTRIARSAVAP